MRTKLRFLHCFRGKNIKSKAKKNKGENIKMSKSTHKPGHRVLAGFLSLICLLSMIIDCAPTAFAADSNYPENVELLFLNDASENVKYSEDGKKADFTITGTTQQVNIRLRISLNKQYEDGQLKVEIPAHGFKTRDGKDYDLKNKDALLNQLGSESVLRLEDDRSKLAGDEGVIILTNNPASAPQIELDLSYTINALSVKDNQSQTFGVKVYDTKSDDQLTPQDLTATFRTSVRTASISKYTESNGVNKGCYYKWDDMLEDRYKLTSKYNIDEEKFNELCKEYDYIGYRLTCSSNRNQPATLYIQDTPVEGAEVVAMSRITSSTSYTTGTPLEQVKTGPYAGCWEYYSESGSRSEYFIVLVRYPKSVAENPNGDNPKLRNDAKVTFVGIDGDAEDVRSGSDYTISVWQGMTAVYGGDIWSVRKEAAEDPAGALNLLRAGKDASFTYKISGIGLTYKYGALDNFTYKNGPYWMEVVDDALYVNGLGDNGTTNERLTPDDFHFKTFTLSVKHKDVSSVALNGDVKESKVRPISDREPVEVYVMTQDNPDVWQLDQKVSLPYKYSSISYSDEVYADENGNRTFSIKHENAYRLKYVYKNANGDIELNSNVTGVLKGTGTTVKKVLENMEKIHLENFQLFNWDGQMGYDGKGKWENPNDGATISTSDPWVKQDLLALDASLYSGHSNAEGNVRIATRLPASNNITALDSMSGAGKASNGIKEQNKRLYGEYYISAVTGKAGSEEDLKKLVDLGIIQADKTVVFHELLPVGMSLESVQPATTGFSPTFSNYSWDKDVCTYPFYAQNVTDMNPEIKTAVTDNYKGTLRQMVTITVTYPDTPIVRIGTDKSNCYCVGSVMKIKTVAEYSDLLSTTLDNYMEAQFLDKNGKPIELPGVGALADDGETFQNVKDRNGKNAFNDVDNDSNTTKKTVVAATASNTVDLFYSDTKLIKKIKADDYDTYFKDYTQTYAGHNYTYQIKFFASQGTSKNVVIFDPIEEGYNEKEYQGLAHWKGKLYGVDLTEARDQGFNDIRVFVNTSKYYTHEELDTDYSRNYDGLQPKDLTAANGWQQVDPDNYTGWADVKTIAFSVGEDVEFGEADNLPKSISVYLKMTAPDTVSPEQTASKQVLAYNAPSYYSEKRMGASGWSKDTTTANVVTIGLKSAIVEMPSITKNMTGSALPTRFEDTCTFNIKPIGSSVVPRKYNNGTWGNTISSVDLNVNSKSTISTRNGSLYFTEPGKHQYEITEKQGSKAGVTYSKAKYRVDISITDQRRDIQYDPDTILKSTMTIYKTHNDDGEELAEPQKVTNISFNNKYTTTPVEFTIPTVYKKITGTSRPEEKEFTFAVSNFDVEGGKTPPTPEKTTVTIKGEGSASFGKIKFTESGVYDFIMYEVNSNQKGYTYDTHGFWVRVTVENDNSVLKVTKTEINRLDPSVMVPEPVQQVEFANAYSPVPSNAVLLPEVLKTFSGTERPSDKDFSFTLTAKDGAPLPNKTKLTITGAGKASFGAVSFSHEGTYVYQITEDDIDPNLTGYTKDRSVYTYTVTVTDKGGVLDAQGKLTKDGSAANDVIFTNNYTPLPCSLNLPVAIKKITGPARPSEKTFMFEIKAADGSTAPLPASTVTAVIGEGTAAAFGEVTFDKAGTYLYDIFERDLDDSYKGYTKDDSVYRLEVTVKDVDGKLTAGYRLLRNNKETGELVFVNDYSPKAVETELEIEKQVKGDAPSSKENYRFEITAADGAPLPLEIKLSILGKGKGKFGKWTYTQAGTYVYTVREIAGANSKCEYDKTVYTVTDVVTDNDGVLEMTRTITSGKKTVNSIVFLNTYKTVKPKTNKPKGKQPEDTPPDTGSKHSAGTCFGAVIVLAAALCIAKRYNDANEVEED